MSSARPDLAGDVLLGGHRPLLGVLEPGAVRGAVLVAPVVEAAVADEHLGEDEVEELGEHVEPGRRGRRLDPLARKRRERALEAVGDVRVEVGDPRRDGVPAQRPALRAAARRRRSAASSGSQSRDGAGHRPGMVEASARAARSRGSRGARASA